MKMMKKKHKWLWEEEIGRESILRDQSNSNYKNPNVQIGSFKSELLALGP